MRVSRLAAAMALVALTTAAEGQQTDAAHGQNFGDLMGQIGKMLDISPKELERASPEERRKLMQRRGEELSERMRARFDERSEMSPDDLGAAGETEKQILGRGAEALPESARNELPLPAPPPSGFADGSIPLPAGDGHLANVVVATPEGREVLLVVADAVGREIVLREARTIPFQAKLDLGELSSDPSRLVLEVIDADSHGVLHRYRPVASIPAEMGAGPVR